MVADRRAAPAPASAASARPRSAPPSGLYLMALSSRFVTTCSNRNASTAAWTLRSRPTGSAGAGRSGSAPGRRSRRTSSVRFSSWRSSVSRSASRRVISRSCVTSLERFWAWRWIIVSARCCCAGSTSRPTVGHPQQPLRQAAQAGDRRLQLVGGHRQELVALAHGVAGLGRLAPRGLLGLVQPGPVDRRARPDPRRSGGSPDPPRRTADGCRVPTSSTPEHAPLHAERRPDQRASARRGSATDPTSRTAGTSSKTTPRRSEAICPTMPCPSGMRGPSDGRSSAAARARPPARVRPSWVRSRAPRQRRPAGSRRSAPAARRADRPGSDGRARPR